MKKLVPLFILLILLISQLSCSVRAILAPPFPVYEIPLSGRSMLGSGKTEHGLYLGSYNINQFENVVEKEINVYEYDFRNHSNRFSYQLKNTRKNFVDLLTYEVPYCYKTTDNKEIFFRHKWTGSTYSVSKTEDEKEEIIFERTNLNNNHVIVFVIVDALKKNKYLYNFSSGDQFESKNYEILQYDVISGSIVKVAEGNGRLYSIPYYETKNYLYTEVRDIGQPRKVFCFRKPSYTLEKITPIERQYLVGSDYNSDLLVSYNHKTFELTLWKGTTIQDTIKCSSYPFEVDEVTIKAHKGKIYLLAIIEEAFDTEKRTLRWMEFDPITKKLNEKNWNQDLQYRFNRGNYKSIRNDYYILGYEKKTRKVVFGIVDLIQGTINYRETNHKIPKDLEFEESFFINEVYCFWSEGTTFNDTDLTGEKQTYNPMAYYCSLEEPLLQKLNK